MTESTAIMEAEASAGARRAERRFLEEAEFNRIYARTARPLAAYLSRMMGDAEAAGDLVQETYLRLLRIKLPPMDERQSTSYVYRIASRLAQDRWRRQAIDRRWRESLTGIAPRPAGGGAERIDVARLLDRLRPRDRALLWLAYVEGQSHVDIGRILDLKTASVKVLLFRARRRMASMMSKAGLAPEVN